MTAPQVIQSALTGSAYTSSAGAVFLGWHSDEWGIAAMVVGIVVSILTYGTSAYFNWRRSKKE